MKTRLLLVEVLVRSAGGAVWVLTPQYSDGDTILSKEHRLSDETLNQGPVSLWSLKIP